MKLQTILLFFAIGFASLHAQEGKAPAADEKPAAAPSDGAAKLESLNKLAAETLTQETNDLRSEISKLKLERELITELEAHLWGRDRAHR
jgi:hypothetical protein